MHRQNSNRGQSLIEALVVITLLGLLVTPIVMSINRLNIKFRSLHTDAQAQLITQKNLEIATNIIQSAVWLDLPHPLEPQTYAPPQYPNWQFVPATSPVEVQGGYKTWLTIQPVCRDSNFDYVEYHLNCQTDPFALEVISETIWSNNRSSKISTIFANLTSDPNDPTNSHKVWVCHTPPGSPENAHILWIDKNAWENGHSPHNAHNLDFLVSGPYDPSCPPAN